MYKQIITIAILVLSALLSSAQGYSNIGERTIEFKDQRRNRPLITEVWYPTADTLTAADKKFSPFTRIPTVRDGVLPVGKHPLIMLSHGTGGGRLTLEWLAQALVKNGFIVASVDHWGNTFYNKIAIEFVKPWERPLDISFVLGSLLNNAQFKIVIDPQRIGMAGFSLGAYTTLALAGADLDFDKLRNYYKTTGKKEITIPEYPNLIGMLDDTALVAAAHKIHSLKDDRIKAFFAISPPMGSGINTLQQVKNIKAPVYLVGTQSDSIAPVVTNARLYHKLIKTAQYTELPGKVGHYVMLQEAIEEVKKSDPVYFTDDPSVSRHQVHLQVDSLAVKFFKKRLE